MLYLADNLAYIPFTVVDEPLFVIHHIDIMISVSGSNLLQTFKEVTTYSIYFCNHKSVVTDSTTIYCLNRSMIKCMLIVL